MLKVASGVLAAGIAVAILAGCGDDLPPDAVAEVGGAVITKADFDRRAERISLPGMQLPNDVFDPPDFDRCVAAQRGHVPAGTPPDAMKALCRRLFDRLKVKVMASLLADEWVRQEARRRGITISDSGMAHSLRSYLRVHGGLSKQVLRRHLSRPGRARGGVYDEIRADVLEATLADRIARRVPDVTDDAVARYYERHKDRFVPRERRDIRIVLAKTRRRAQRAKAMLADGASWADVSSAYSIDAGSRARGGKMSGLAEGQQEKELDRAVFAAPAHQLRGPLRTQFGWYVFEVVGSRSPRVLSLDEARPRIRALLRRRREQRAFAAFNRDFRERYRPVTVCAAEYTVPDCGNA